MIKLHVGKNIRAQNSYVPQRTNMFLWNITSKKLSIVTFIFVAVFAIKP